MTKKCFSGHDTALILYLLLSMTLWELKIKYKFILVDKFCHNSKEWLKIGFQALSNLPMATSFITSLRSNFQVNHRQVQRLKIPTKSPPRHL